MPDSPTPASTPPVFPDLEESLRHFDSIETASTPGEALAAVLTVLDVQPDPAQPDHFDGSSYRPPWGRIFGGQVLGQSLVAAARTVDDGRPVHSLHAYFLRAGDPGVPISFDVERLRDGRSFSARRTQAIQNGKPILSMIASFQQPAAGLDHQVEMPDVPGPDELPSLDELFGHVKIPAVKQMLHSRPVDMRYVDGPLFLNQGLKKSAHQAVWFRAAGTMPDDQLMHTALLAYASDYTLLEAALRRHGLGWSDHKTMKTASLDHAMWFHRPARTDEWLLYAQESPSASGARGLGMGRIFTADGVLVASTAQEGMIRVPMD